MAELVKPGFYQTSFVVLFLVAALLLLMNKLWFDKRFTINIKAPNIYIFEYESRAQNLFSLYNLNSLLFKIISYTLYVVALFKTVSSSQDWSKKQFPEWHKLLIAVAFYLVLKFIFEIVLIILIKKGKFLSKIRFIRTAYENYTVFYLFILAFLTYYFPYQTPLFFYLIISVSIVWFVTLWLNLYNSLSKHTDLKTYQIFLYLCLSEILPIILVTGWIIFQIL